MSVSPWLAGSLLIWVPFLKWMKSSLLPWTPTPKDSTTGLDAPSSPWNLTRQATTLTSNELELFTDHAFLFYTGSKDFQVQRYPKKLIFKLSGNYLIYGEVCKVDGADYDVIKFTKVDLDAQCRGTNDKVTKPRWTTSWKTSSNVSSFSGC